MGHTFLFRGSPKGRADNIDYWLTVLAGDAALLSDGAGGRSFAQLSERLSSLAADRSRKGRTKYRGAVREAVETLLAREETLWASRTSFPFYPSLAAHLQRKARYALRLVRSGEAAGAGGSASAMKETAFCLRLVKDTAELCRQYLDPSERTAYAQTAVHCDALADLCDRSEVYGASCGREQDCSAFAAEGAAAVGAYREYLAELDGRVKEGRLLAAFPPTFLVWADTTCTPVHRCLKRLARGKMIVGVADDDITAEDVRTEEIADEDVSECTGAEPEAECDAVLVIPTEETTEHECGSQTAKEQPCETVLAMSSEPTAERIYAKASDYKNVVQKKREHSIIKPRPLGRR